MRVRPDSHVEAWFQQTPDTLMFVSTLTLGEIRKGIVSLSVGRKKQQLETWLERTLRASFIGRTLPIDETVADRWGWLDAEAGQRGRPLPVVDGLLAATALEHNLTLVTRNTRDFAHLPIRVFSPWKT
jgi:predicted nucleic acid-binding protein